MIHCIFLCFLQDKWRNLLRASGAHVPGKKKEVSPSVTISSSYLSISYCHQLFLSSSIISSSLSLMLTLSTVDFSLLCLAPVYHAVSFSFPRPLPLLLFLLSLSLTSI